MSIIDDLKTALSSASPADRQALGEAVAPILRQQRLAAVAADLQQRATSAYNRNVAALDDARQQIAADQLDAAETALTALAVTIPA